MTVLINTRDNPGEFDALSTLREGEPYFPLVGRDRFAPPLIYEWAEKNRRRALREFEEGRITKAKRDEELRKSTEAEMIAESMVEYKNGWKAQTATSQREERTSYSGHELPEDTKRSDKLQSLSARAASAMNNAVAEINELFEFLATYSDPQAQTLRLALLATMTHLRARSDEVRPSRPMLPIAKKEEGE